ncbi:MAG TPA: sporulation protein YabP [Symbiobacteriaceae bacterium]|jgi:sporulation protein YabP
MDNKGIRGEARILGAGMTGSEHPAGGSREHILNISNREQVTIQGVLSVDSFDDEEIILETDMGTLTLRGEELHIKQLDLDSAKFAVEGFIMSCLYSTPRQRPGGRPTKSRSFLERLLK